MKRILLFIFFFITVSLGAESYNNFSFSLGTSYADDKVANTTYSGTMIGLDYMFSRNFIGGVKFFTLPTDFTVMNIGFRTNQDIVFSVYTGADTASSALFGIGIGYDFFVKKSSTFTSLGLYMDWIAGEVGSAYDITSQGVLLIGLRAGMGD